jgi:peptidoglycan/xylan/chitin deacetylase (PgdA/CDA1 family)
VVAKTDQEIMDQKAKNIIALKARFLPLNWLRMGRKFPPVLPFYHVVSPHEPDYVSSYRVRTPEEFEQELDYLLKHFRAVDLDEAITMPRKNQFHLSFDDGMKECLTVIAPILKRKGVPATFFISPTFIDNKGLFHRFKRAILETKGVIKPGGKRFYHHESGELDKLAALHEVSFAGYQPYLSGTELDELHNLGFNIGAHSMDHPEMWLLSEEQQLSQVTESMKWVIGRYNPSIRAFAFPFTDDGIGLPLFQKIQQSGLVDVTFGTAGLKYDMAPKHFQRIPIERTPDWSIKKSVHFEYLYQHIRQLSFSNRVKR